MSNDKSAAEIVRGLRCWGGLTTPCKSEAGNCYYIDHGWPVHCREKVCNDAATMLESQAAEIARLNEMLADSFQGHLLNELQRTEAQLAASRQETRAAVEELDILHERLGGELPKRCEECELWGKAGWSQYAIGYCEGDDHPHKGTDFCNRWRGPQGAGEDHHG